MGRNEFSNPAFSVSREAGGLRIQVPVKIDRFRTLLNFVWLLVWAAGEAAIVGSILGGSSPVGPLPSVPLPLAGLFLAGFTVAGAAVLWRWLWCLGGGETLLVARDALSVRRGIWGFGYSRTFGLESIRGVKAARLGYRLIHPSWGGMFVGHDDGQIVIDSAGRRYAYAKGLEEAEAGDLADLLEKEMGFQSFEPLHSKTRLVFSK